MDGEVVRIVTPLPLTDEQRKHIQTRMAKFLGGNLLSFQEEIDESLIGGVVLFVRDIIIDCSIRTQLERIRESIMKGE
jgi:F-type H+-transporting ATPase subunit delta